MILLVEQDEVSSYDRYQLRELVEKTTLDHRQQLEVCRQIDNCSTTEEMEEISQRLYLNLIQDKDRIAMGFNYNQGDIKKALKLMR